MVVPAMQLASKIPDMSVQLWSSALLKGTAVSQHKVTVRFMFEGVEEENRFLFWPDGGAKEQLLVSWTEMNLEYTV